MTIPGGHQQERAVAPNARTTTNSRTPSTERLEQWGSIRIGNSSAAGLILTW